MATKRYAVELTRAELEAIYRAAVHCPAILVGGGRTRGSPWQRGLDRIGEAIAIAKQESSTRGGNG